MTITPPIFLFSVTTQVSKRNDRIGWSSYVCVGNMARSSGGAWVSDIMWRNSVVTPTLAVAGLLISGGTPTGHSWSDDCSKSWQYRSKNLSFDGCHMYGMQNGHYLWYAVCCYTFCLSRPFKNSPYMICHSSPSLHPAESNDTDPQLANNAKNTPLRYLHGKQGCWFTGIAFRYLRWAYQKGGVVKVLYEIVVGHHYCMGMAVRRRFRANYLRYWRCM